MSDRLTASRLIAASSIASALLAAALFGIYLHEGSVLAAAQAADSLADVLLAIGLLVSVWIARQPPDHSHHFGHGQAEPVAALVASFVAAQLGISVTQAAIGSLSGRGVMQLSALALAVFGAKVVFKALIALAAYQRRRASPALDALAIDARNDVLVGVIAVAGGVGVNSGMPRLDAILAIPVGVLIIVSALALAIRSVKLLMGAAPDKSRLEALRETARAVEGVRLVEDLRARTTGTGIEAALCIGVDPTLTVSAAHEIADDVEHALEAEDDVVSADVHVHPG